MSMSEPARHAARLARPGRILIRGVNWLGDAVMATPALQRLHEAFPGAELTWFGPAHLSELWRGHPHVRHVIGFERGWSVWKAARRLRDGAFDLAVILPNSPRSALEVFLAGVPERVGYRRPGRTWLLTCPVPQRANEVRMRKRGSREVRRLARQGRTSRPGPPTSWPPRAHHIYQYLHLVAAVGADPAPVTPRLFVSEDEKQAACNKFDLPLDPAEAPPVLGLHPGAAYGPAKQWPWERFAEAAWRVQRETGGPVLVFGSAADRPLVERIVEWTQSQRPRRPSADGPALRSLAGQTTLRELMALLAVCRVVLSNDSGPMHVAAAVGARTVVPFGSTSPGLTGPGLPGDQRHRLLQSQAPCAPCFRRTCPIDLRCLREISVDAVVAAVLEACRAG